MGELLRMTFVLEANSWHGNATERLWVESLGKGRFRIRNSPFYVFGLSNEDVVLGKEIDGLLHFEKVLLRGGHSTYRIMLGEAGLNSPEFSRCWSPLAALGCSFEEGPVLAVDVPAQANIQDAYELLQTGENAGVWDFQEGHCGHIVS